MNSLKTYLLIGFCGTLFMLGTAVAEDARPVPSPESGDDGWRWTSNGWENISTWSQPPQPYPKLTPLLANEPPRPRYDFHPAALAFLQLATAMSGFVLLPPRRD